MVRSDWPTDFGWQSGAVRRAGEMAVRLCSPARRRQFEACSPAVRWRRGL